MHLNGVAPPELGQDNASEGKTRITRRDIAIAILIGALTFFVFNLNMRTISAVDTYVNRYLPFSILHSHSVLLNPIASTVAQGRRLPAFKNEGTAFWVVDGRDDNLVSLYPIVIPVIVSPLYVPAVAYLDARGWDPHLFDLLARIMEKLCASLITAMSVALLYLLLRRRGPPGTAALLSIAYAFGTTTWVISSQALWMHGMAQLLIVTTMLLLTGKPTVPRVLMAGLLCALIAANRQPDAVIAAALGLYGLRWAGRRFPLLIAAGLLPVALLLAYNLIVVGHFAGAYALRERPEHYNDDIVDGIAGLLFSPMRGLFVFSPFLLFVPLLVRRAFREPGTRALTLAVVLAMATQVVAYAFFDWRQGTSWGPRWLTDMLPLSMWLLPPIVTTLSRPGRVVFGAACAVAIAIQTVGAFWYTGAIDAAVQAQNHDDRMRPMWKVGNAAFIAELNHPPAAADLFRAVRGNIDLIDVVEDEGDRYVDMAGWALADRRTPAEIAVLVDGEEVTGTKAFFTRPDVVEALGAQSPAGWHLRFPADQFAPGRHLVTVVVRADLGGEVRVLQGTSFNLAIDPARRERQLADAAGHAVHRLTEHQQSGGYWLTAFTKGPRFEHPQVELNTYLNAIMLDVAGPAATTPPVQEMLGRARAYLTSQIEANGLVRYHGRPNAPTMGVLGCAITPDSDDTALVWRVAPGANRDLLAKAMATIGRFRRADGLYRTWLAERADYQCLDPGRDPNPADIGIQMHILMLLAQQDPPAAQALCHALAQRAGDDDMWVYYAAAPPLVILRLADLDKAGCALQLPSSRLRTTIPEQEPWVQAAQFLLDLHHGEGTPKLYRRISRLLRELAAKNFAVVAGAPPLLYHNDFSANVRRYYWSEDLGYALWLRLYHERQKLGRQLGCDDAAVQECGNR